MSATGTIHTLELSDGVIVTLVHRPATSTTTRGAVLYVHGFVDYFFQDHVADHLNARGFDFYAVDLRGYGRSLREGDVPWYIADIAAYHEDLDAAMARIQADGHARIVVLAHSTGGLIVPLWLHDRRPQGVAALVLNSPWLDLQADWLMRTIGTWAIRALARVKPMAKLPQGLESVYAKSIHESAEGEWTFDTAWKPLTPQPVYVGWLAAIRRGQARLHRGLNLPVPILVMRSDRSLLRLKRWTPEAMRADTVLDVAQMEQWAPALGPHVTTVVIPGGMHDLFLSAAPVRAHAFAVMDAWLDEVIGDE